MSDTYKLQSPAKPKTGLLALDECAFFISKPIGSIIVPRRDFPPINALISKEDLIHIDPFSSEVPLDEYISSVPHDLVPSSPPSTPFVDYLSTDPPEAMPTSFPASPLVSSPPSTSSPPLLLVYSRRQAPHLLVVSALAALSSAFEDSDPVEHRYPTRVRRPPNRLEAQSYKEACQDSNWIRPMEDELSALQKTSTWELVHLPTGKNLVGCKWVHKVKTHSDVLLSVTRLVCFEIKDLGPLWYFLNIEVASSPRGYFLSPAKYANEVNHRADLTDTKSLLLSSTSSLDLVAYADSNWASDVTDHKSTFGFCMSLGDSLISWKSKQQTVVSRSTIEAEYRAMAYAIAEIV
ncbi:uncharacterized protein LOC114270712 [Camellia sinensis]|uniref:uncharacterized protein LOC114270712 n=1 Tax=Camellia sinensis TaxID=4442 RepID=UPI0010357A1E|nr:uncharacterized protein LOC114270712 [Camellia sinensis]